MFLIVGLGNPGSEYKNTRHNAGFMALAVIMLQYPCCSPKVKFQAEITEAIIGGCKVLLAKPQTYMNNSGQSVGQIARFYKIPLEQIIVLHDDLDLALGRVKTKIGGGSGGHNGLKSLDSHIGKEYLRVRIGISHPGVGGEVSDYVLNNFTKSEFVDINEVFYEIADALPLLLSGQQDNFMNRVARLHQSIKD
jgi:PTH1 family peptidyl-tRNA hydrolase